MNDGFQLAGRHADGHHPAGRDTADLRAVKVTEMPQQFLHGAGGPRLDGGHVITAIERRMTSSRPAGIHKPRTRSAAMPMTSGAAVTAADPRSP